MGLLQCSKSKFENICSIADELRKKNCQTTARGSHNEVKLHLGTLTNQLEDILNRENAMWKQWCKTL